jgi:hypothetical protein
MADAERNGMAKDFSWNASAREYIRVYERARQLRSLPPATVANHSVAPLAATLK